MRSRHLLNALALTIISVPLVAPVVAPRAQTHNQQQLLLERGPLPEALAGVVNRKKERIIQELAKVANSSGGEWAGVYYLHDGPTAGTQLHWAPAAGFVVWWSTCCFWGWDPLECGGKRSATPLWIKLKMEFNETNPKRRRRFALAAHSKFLIGGKAMI